MQIIWKLNKIFACTAWIRNEHDNVRHRLLTEFDGRRRRLWQTTAVAFTFSPLCWKKAVFCSVTHSNRFCFFVRLDFGCCSANGTWHVNTVHWTSQRHVSTPQAEWCEHFSNAHAMCPVVITSVPIESVCSTWKQPKIPNLFTHSICDNEFYEEDKQRKKSKRNQIHLQLQNLTFFVLLNETRKCRMKRNSS